MKLERLQIENFRQYHERQRIEFSKDAHRNVTVIHGVNGAGKTSMFLAINWCLYGEGTENVGELLSKECVRLAPMGEQLRCSVELTFTHDGQRFLVRRVLLGIKQEDGSVRLDDFPEFTMMRTRADGQAEPVNSPITAMNAILPANVRTYFLFDGEKIDHFARPEAASEVRQAIYLVLRLEVLDRARKHLEETAREYRRDLRQVSSAELQVLLDSSEKARASKSQAEQRRSELRAEIDSANRKIADIDQRLREMRSVSQLQQQRENAELSLRQLRAEQETRLSELRTLASGGYLSVARPVIERALAVLDDKRERGEIPSNIRQQFVQDLLAQRVCICGRPFSAHGPEYERLVAYLERSIPGGLEEDILETSGFLRALFPQIDHDVLSRDHARQRYVELKDLIRAQEAVLGELENQLKGSPLEDVSQLERQRQAFRADIDSNMLEIGALNERLSQLTKEITELDEAIARAEKDAERGRVLGKKLDLAQQAADAIDQTYESFADEMRRAIETRTKEIFRSLILKEGHFQDVILGQDYNLEVIDRYGLPARPELSAGERQVLSLAFIAAIASVSGEEAPLVMDTPFGRLSSHHRNTITQQLPFLADQLVLLVTDEELRDQARRNLEPRIGSEYRLVFDPATSCTQIIEG